MATSKIGNTFGQLGDAVEPKLDIVVNSLANGAALYVEVKARSNVSDEWASAFRKNLAAHGLVQLDAYFLLVLQDYFYLWLPGHSVKEEPPDHKASTSDAVLRYAGKTPVKMFGEAGLEMLIAAWIGDLIVSKVDSSEYPELAWVIDSGLYDAIRGGSIQGQAVA